MLFAGCVNQYPTDSVTSVTARTNSTDLIGVTITGPITMWAQPITVEYQNSDLSLFTSVPSAAPSTTPTASPGASPPLSSHMTATQIGSSGGTSSPSSLSTGDKVGIGIGVTIGSLVLLIGLAIFIFLRKKRVKDVVKQNPSNDAVEVAGKELPRELDGLNTPDPQQRYELPA